MAGRWIARAAVAAIFALGAVCGGIAVHLYTLHVQSEIAHDPAPLAKFLVMQLDRDLDLSDEQERQVREIILQVRSESLTDAEMRSCVIPKAREIFEKGTERIAGVLDDRQRARFAELASERRKLLDDLGK